MRYSMGSGRKPISAECFRLLGLVTEVQNDVEVVKPVLDELEAMRLSCSLGMLSSVNPKDFEMEMLEAREFDEDFALFLRKEVFGEGKRGGGHAADGIKVLSLFGKQAGVKHKLKQLGCWSVEMEDELKTIDQGIYCVTSEDGERGRTLVVFAWLQDCLFAKHRLRDTATYVLRFLMCLSPDMMCCLSPEDVEHIEKAVAAVATSDLDAWKSFSVAFHVEKQEEEKDAVLCEHATSVPLPSLGNAREIKMLKGSYPAISVLKSAPATKRSERTKKSFDSPAEFTKWMVAQSEGRSLQLGFGYMDLEPQFRDDMLKAAGRWPEAALQKISDEFERSRFNVDEQTKDRVQIHIEERRARLIEAIDKLFDLDVLFNAQKDECAFAVLNTLIGEVQHDHPIWSNVDNATRVMLTFPLRLKNQMKDLVAVFHSQQARTENSNDKSLGTLLQELTISEQKLNSRDGVIQKAGKALLDWIRGKGTESMSAEFRLAVGDSMNEIRGKWWEAVGKVFQVAESVLLKRWNEGTQTSFRLTRDEDHQRAISTAFKELLCEWQAQSGNTLKTTIRVRRRNREIFCDVDGEQWQPATDQVEIVKLKMGDTGGFGTELLGVHRLQPGEEVTAAYTVKNHCAVLVTTRGGHSFVERVDFPFGQYLWSERRANVGFSRRFGRTATLCDFNVHERVLAFIEQSGSAMLYRFNEAFTSLEVFKHVDLAVRTSLALPVTDMLVMDGSLYLTDGNGAIQSVNLRNQQTSRSVQVLPQDPTVWRSALFPLADGMVLGYVSATKSSSLLEPAQLVGGIAALSSEDFRDIPVSAASVNLLWMADKTSVQCIDDMLFAVDSAVKRIKVIQLGVTVRSESFRIRHSSESGIHSHNREAGTPAVAEETDHWLRTFFHTFEKFPVRGLIRGLDDSKTTLKLRLASQEALPQSTEESCRCFLEVIMRDLRKLNKPLGGMDLTRGLTFMGDSSVDGLANLSVRSIRSFLQELITFVPIQICRAEANALTVMADGQAESMGDQSQQLQAVDIARSIRFGLLSPLLESWQGRCIVITSMGKQSTGKSYLLNHLTGSSFAIAGARCTDGAWMTVRILPNDVLLVVLDFEGLGSFERTEQEDVFLSLLNASISMFTIFRMEMRYDKEIDDLFAKFQKGVALIKGDPGLFRGKLYMSVKDVNPNDQRGVLGEFVGKFQKLLGANKESNFLTDLYSGKLDINCSPPLGTIGYYQSLMHAQSFIEGSLCAGESTGFPTGKAFLNCIRLVLAKISILDWTSLDEGAKQFQLSDVCSKLPGLVRTGCIVPQEYVMKEEPIAGYLKEDIRTAANGRVLNVNIVAMRSLFPTMAEKWAALNTSVDLDNLPDWEIDLGFDCCSTKDETTARVRKAIMELFQLFIDLNVNMRGVRLTREFLSDFDAFLAYLVRRRKARVNLWAKEAFSDRVPDEWKAVEQQFLGRFQALFTRCQSECAKCRLGCMETATHSGTTDHDCGGSHFCEGRCGYCEAGGQVGKTPPCAKEAGHDGCCECRDGDHTCGVECCMAGSPNCGKRCSQKIGHTGLHKCDVTIHMCGESCSVKNCSGRCILSVETPHTAHKCVEVRCMEKCLMDECGELCGVMDHFHGQEDVAVAFSVENGNEKDTEIFDAASEAPVVHMCANGHSCQVLCAEEGICRVDVFLKQSSKTFEGARSKFQYTFQEMNGSRKKCCKELPPGQQTHQGAHTCISAAATAAAPSDGDQSNAEERTIHYCDVRCPCCSYFCKKQFGHFGVHTTSHGNMRNTFFVSDMEEIDVEDRKYRVGEQGVAEMCNLYCSKMGREHVHYLECERESQDKCMYAGGTTDQRRHCTRTLEPKPEKGMDEILHEQFWKTLGWEDPCASKMERELFGKCGYKCDAPDHDEKPSYCMLPAWHKPEQKPSAGYDGLSYVSGHKFECSHVASGGKMHHVFVLDCSGSMSGRPWSDLMAAWKEYVYNRIADGASLDLVSVVTFDHIAQIVYEARNITTMTQASIPFRGGGTTYAAGLRSANEILSRMNFATYKPVVVFFSDGQPCDPLQGEQMATHIKECYDKYGLQAFAVGFGAINLHILEQVAHKMGGAYHRVLTGNEMKTTFFSISASLSTRAGLALAKPSHECACVICGQDLASGETVKPQPCSHELHKACLDSLVSNAQQDGECARCPSCRREVSGQQ